MSKGSQRQPHSADAGEDGSGTAAFFRDRARRAGVAQALALLERFGGNEPPRSGDEFE